MNFVITQEQGNQILNYLVKRPYEEVVSLVSVMVNLPAEKVDPVKKAEALKPAKKSKKA